MQISAHLDLDLLALEQDDELNLMIELTAPAPPGLAPRAPATLQAVIDRSGSMRDGRLDAACDALCALVDRLAPTDQLGVIGFDHAVEVVVPAGPVTDKTAVKRAISGSPPEAAPTCPAATCVVFRR